MRRVHQKGVALITALLVVALVTTTAIAMAARQQLDIRRTANILQRDQAYVYALGAEVMAREVLGKDQANVDEKDEDWATSAISIPFQGGILSAALEDLQGRFNLNNLVVNGVRSDADVERLKNLLTIIKEKSEDRDIWKDAEPNDLANAALDWIDKDDNVESPGGAEDNDYLQRERPYRTANIPMASTSELLLVRGFTLPIYRQVAPYVTALPLRTKINVNTASMEVLRALTDEQPCLDVSKIKRPDTAKASAAAATESSTENYTVFRSAAMEDFMQHPSTTPCELIGIKYTRPGVQPPATPTPGVKVAPAEVLSVNSNYFQVNAYAEVGADDHRVRVKLYSVLQRNNGKIASLTRVQGFE